MSNAPIATIRVGRIKATVWENFDDQQRAFHTTTLTRSYRDKNDQWQEATSFSLEDMPRLRLASDKVFEVIHERLSELSKGKQAAAANQKEEPEKAEEPAKKASARKRAKQTTFTDKIDAERENGTAAKR